MDFINSQLLHVRVVRIFIKNNVTVNITDTKSLLPAQR